MLALLFIVGVATAAFSPALFRGKILAPLDITTTVLAPWKENANGGKPHNHNPSDAVTQYLPYRIHAEKSFKEDGYIGWNPYEMGGSNLAANTMALPASWTMQLHRFLPFEQAWDLGILGEFLIAGVGMLVFLRSRSLPWLACTLGALAYMGNSQFIIWIYHRWALSSFSWMPWVLWAAAHGLSWKNPSPRQLLLPFFLALAISGSSLQHMVFVGLACGCLVMGAIPDVRSSLKQWPSVLCWSAAFMLALGMTAFTLVPQVSAYFINIGIGNTRGGIGYPNGPLQPVLNLVAIPAQIWPWLLGDPQTIDSWRLLKSGFMSLAYLGTIPMILAIAGLFVKSMPRQAKWLILVGLLIPLTPLVGPLYHRVQIIFLLGGAWMAAEMIAGFSTTSPRKLIRGVSVVVILIGVALFAGTLLPTGIRKNIENQVVTKSVAATAGSNFGDDSAWIEKRAVTWVDRFSLVNPRTAWVYGLLVLGTGGLILAGRRQTTVGNFIIIWATSLELMTLFQTWTTFSDPRDLLPENPAIRKVGELAGDRRVLQRSPGVAFADIFATPNLLSSYSIQSVDFYESIQYHSSWITLAKESPETRLVLSGVGISVRPIDSPPEPGTENWPVLDTAAGYVIQNNPASVSPVSAGTGAIPGTPALAIEALKNSLPIKISEQTMNHVSFGLPDGRSWVRISRNWHESWRWRAEGGPWQKFEPGPDASCWIKSPPTGAARIEARFFPRPVWLSGISVGACLSALLVIPLCGLRRGSGRPEN